MYCSRRRGWSVVALVGSNAARRPLVRPFVSLYGDYSDTKARAILNIRNHRGLRNLGVCSMSIVGLGTVPISLPLSHWKAWNVGNKINPRTASGARA